MTRKAPHQPLPDETISKRKARPGFTLAELLIVISIIGILTAAAIPIFLDQKFRAEGAASLSWASNEARKCAASMATTQSGDEFISSPEPANTDPRVSTSPGSCPGQPSWSATIEGTQYTYTAEASGSVSRSVN